MDVEPRINADETRIIDPVGNLGDELLHRELTQSIIGAAFAVHSELGPGFLEKVYEIVICEIKAVRAIAPEHHAHLLNYLKATGLEPQT